MTEPQFKIGDHVRVGQGAKLWQITEFWNPTFGAPMASLSPAADGGYTNMSAALDRLTLVEATS